MTSNFISYLQIWFYFLWFSNFFEQILLLFVYVPNNWEILYLETFKILNIFMCFIMFRYRILSYGSIDFYGPKKNGPSK